MKKQKQSWKRIIIIFILFTFLFITIFSFLDYYDFYAINPYLLTVIAVIFGVISTYRHIKNGERSKIDDIADKL